MKNSSVQLVRKCRVLPILIYTLKSCFYLTMVIELDLDYFYFPFVPVLK